MALEQLWGFVATYLLILLTPGPNLVLLGSALAIGGLRCAVLASFGIALGACVLGATALAALGLATSAGEAWAVGGRLIGAVLLLWLAFRFARRPRLGTAGAASRMGAGDGDMAAIFLAGFWAAATNPLTGAFVMGQMLGPLAGDGAARALVPWAMGTVALSFFLLATSLLAQPVFCRVLLSHQRAVRLAAACVMAWTAAATLTPLLTASPGIAAPDQVPPGGRG